MVALRMGESSGCDFHVVLMKRPLNLILALKAQAKIQTSTLASAGHFVFIFFDDYDTDLALEIFCQNKCSEIVPVTYDIILERLYSNSYCGRSDEKLGKIELLGF